MQIPEMEQNLKKRFSFFRKLHLNCELEIVAVCKRVMDNVIANVFSKLQTVKNLVRILLKRRRFRARFDSQHVKAFQIVVKFPWERFYHVFSSFLGKLNWKMLPLLLREILEVFVNTLTGDAKNSV